MNHDDFTPHRRHSRLFKGAFAGVALIAIGVIFLFQNFLNIDILGKLWPVFVILAGLAIIVDHNRKS